MNRVNKSGGSRPARLGRSERAKLLRRLRRDAKRIADHFGLTYTAIDAESARVKRRYGSCFSDGRIKIRLNHVRTGRPLKYSSMIDTLCHELAHLKHFHHGPRFRTFYQEVLAWARGAGIYQPGPRAGAQPVTYAADPRGHLAALMGIVFAADASADSDSAGAANTATTGTAAIKPGGLVHAPDEAFDPASAVETQAPGRKPDRPRGRGQRSGRRRREYEQMWLFGQA
jgi:hypothetical protein